MRAVFLDFASLGSEDLDTSELHHCFDELQLYDASTPIRSSSAWPAHK